MINTSVPKPAHVPAHLVRDFDFREFPGHDTDVHLAWKKLHEGPDIFWSPRHGGYWVATRADDIDVMQADHERFSHRRITVPPQNEFPPLAPLEFDPPGHGLPFKAGERILLPKTLHGLDERRFAQPLEVDFARPKAPHAAFGAGPHRCPGSFLARLEMKVFLEQWLERIPEFHIPPGETPRTSSGPVNGVLYLPLAWSKR